MNPVLKVKNLTKTFREQTGFFRFDTFVAVQPVSFTLEAGNTLAIIGENGSGKSTLAKMLVGMVEPSDGEIWVKDQKLTFSDYHFRSQHIRLIFQNPENTFNPRQTIGQLLEAPLKLNTSLTPDEREKRILSTLKQVGIQPDYADYYPNILAAGQKQRVALARALILRPNVIIADEALSALDITTRSQMANLILQLQKEYEIAFIFVTQDLGMAKHISDKMMVMQDGEVVEYGNTAEVLVSPLSEVTQKFVHSYFGEALTADTWRRDPLISGD